jgi:CRISPR-associated protein Cas2
MLIVVAYDIPNDRRRTKVARALTDYGTRVQYSVFECRVDEDRRLDEMLARVGQLIDKETDRLRVYRLCGPCEDRILVEGNDTIPAWEEEGFLII